MRYRGCSSPLSPSVVATLLCSALAAQATLTVGPGGHAQISDAVAAAQPGDLIVVQPGAYLPFHLSIGVRIVAPNGATITTPPGGGGLPWSHNVNPPAGQQATIVGLTYATNTAYPPAEPPVTVIATGNVVFADCVFRNWSDYTSNAVVCNGDIQFDRCRLESPWDCLAVAGGRVVATDCKFYGTSVMWAAGPASGIVATGGDITLMSCDVKGGPYSVSNSNGSPAIRLDGSARMTIVDSTVICGANFSMAGTGVVNNTVNPVLHSRSAISGTYGILSWSPFTAGQGPAFLGPDQQTMLVGGSAPARPTIGAPFGGSVTGPENSLVALVLTFDRTPATVIPIAAQPIHFDPITAAVFTAGFTDVSPTWPGSGTFTWQTASLTAPIFGVQFWLHSLLWDGSIIQVGPASGGIAY